MAGWDEHRCDLPFEVQGHWWLPEDPSSRVPGTLKFSPREGAIIQTIGGLGAVDPNWEGGTELFQLHGELTSATASAMRNPAIPRFGSDLFTR